MKTAISIPDSLFNAADRLAKRMGVSRSELYQRAIEAYLTKHQRKAVTESLNEVYEQNDEGSRLDPALELLQYSSLPEEEW